MIKICPFVEFISFSIAVLLLLEHKMQTENLEHKMQTENKRYAATVL